MESRDYYQPPGATAALPEQFADAPLFALNGRLGRVRYLAYNVLIGMGAVALVLTTAGLMRSVGGEEFFRVMAVIGVVLAAVLVVVATTNGGHPNFWLFTVALAVVVPVAQGLVPNCNTAAMMPVPHVAGTASAVIGTITTAGGALLGGLVTGAFDGTMNAGAGAYTSVGGPDGFVLLVN